MATSAIKLIIGWAIVSSPCPAAEEISEYSLTHCGLTYDVNDPSANSTKYNADMSSVEWRECVSITAGVCDCDAAFFLLVLKNGLSDNEFAMGHNSILDYTIEWTPPGTVYRITQFTQYWQPTSLGDRPQPNHTFVELISYDGTAYLADWVWGIAVGSPFLRVQGNDTSPEPWETIPVSSIHLHLAFDQTVATAATGGDDGYVFMDRLEVEGEPTSKYPTTQPTDLPTHPPTAVPTSQPTVIPSTHPSGEPTSNPTRNITADPTTNTPTFHPSASPTLDPTTSATETAGGNSSSQPVPETTGAPSQSPSRSPSDGASISSTAAPVLTKRESVQFDLMLMLIVSGGLLLFCSGVLTGVCIGCCCRREAQKEEAQLAGVVEHQRTRGSGKPQQTKGVETETMYW